MCDLLEDGGGLAVVSSGVCDHHVFEYKLDVDLSLFLILNEASLGILLSDSFLEEGFHAPTHASMSMSINTQM